MYSRGQYSRAIFRSLCRLKPLSWKLLMRKSISSLRRDGVEQIRYARHKAPLKTPIQVNGSWLELGSMVRPERGVQRVYLSLLSQIVWDCVFVLSLCISFPHFPFSTCFFPLKSSFLSFCFFFRFFLNFPRLLKKF